MYEKHDPFVQTRLIPCCSQECSPIGLPHVIANNMGLSQTHELTNQVPDILFGPFALTNQLRTSKFY